MYHNSVQFAVSHILHLQHCVVTATPVLCFHADSIRAVALNSKYSDFRVTSNLFNNCHWELL